MDTDALFNAPSAADFHLRLDSPCRNTGNTAAAAALSFDIDGDDRVVEGIVDIGADEAYFLTISQPTGSASFTISLHNLPPFDLYLTVFSFDPANQGLGLGTGWWGGLHISLFEVLEQAGTGSPPFMGYLDAVGNATWSITGSAAVAGLSGVTIYSVTRVFDPINYFAEGWSNLTPHTFQ